MLKKGKPVYDILSFLLKLNRVRIDIQSAFSSKLNHFRIYNSQFLENHHYFFGNAFHN